MAGCLLVQPIHWSGIEALERAGLSVRVAESTDMTMVAHQARDCVAVITRNAVFPPTQSSKGAFSA